MLKQWIFSTEAHWMGLAARVVAGAVLFPHGAQKLLGWYGGYGFSGTMNFFTGTMNLPWLVGCMVIIIEFFGALALIGGVAGRLWAALTIVLMLGIIFSAHWSQGFFMNWAGTQQGEGYEYHLLMIGLALVVLLGGSGRWSVDAWFFQ